MRLIVLLLLFSPVVVAGEQPAFFQQPLLLGAHRGGGLLWPENTISAFEQAASRWPEILLEADVRLSKDGQLVLMHDASVDRTTDGTGRVAEKSFEELRALDAGHDFTTDGGQTFPYRGKGIRIPTLQEALKAAPGHRFLIELKASEEGVTPLLKALEDAAVLDRVIIASFNPKVMNEVRKQKPAALHCYDMNTGLRLLQALRGGDWEAYTPAAPLLSVTTEMHTQYKITPAEIAQIQAKGIVYQLHTLNTREEIEQALSNGVKSILTDDPALLDKILSGRKAAAR